MIAISNTSPLIVLTKSNYLKIPQKIFKRVIIPDAVFNEIFQKEDAAANQNLSRSQSYWRGCGGDLQTVGFCRFLD